MKTAISIGVMTVLSGVGATAWAQAPATQTAQTQQTAPARGSSASPAASLSDDAEKETARQHLELQAMDSDENGLVSRQEFMAHYEGLYADMEKDSAGMISLTDLAGRSAAGQPADSANRSPVTP